MRRCEGSRPKTLFSVSDEGWKEKSGWDDEVSKFNVRMLAGGDNGFVDTHSYITTVIMI